jgi:hypothetical protein
MLTCNHLAVLERHLGSDFFRGQRVLALGNVSPSALAWLDAKGSLTNRLDPDVVIHWGLLSQLDCLESHLEYACRKSFVILLETEVLDARERICTRVVTHDAQARVTPSAAYVEHLLSRHGFEAQRVLDEDLGVYHWPVKDSFDVGRRRLWICRRRHLLPPEPA